MGLMGTMPLFMYTPSSLETSRKGTEMIHRCFSLDDPASQEYQNCVYYLYVLEVVSCQQHVRVLWDYGAHLVTKHQWT